MSFSKILPLFSGRHEECLQKIWHHLHKLKKIHLKNTVLLVINWHPTGNVLSISAFEKKMLLKNSSRGSLCRKQLIFSFLQMKDEWIFFLVLERRGNVTKKLTKEPKTATKGILTWVDCLTPSFLEKEDAMDWRVSWRRRMSEKCVRVSHDDRNN